MIAYMHTAEWASMIGLNEVARRGEIIRISDGELADERDGVYEVLEVMHTAGSGRIDFYARRVGDAGNRVGWTAMESILCLNGDADEAEARADAA